MDDFFDVLLDCHWSKYIRFTNTQCIDFWVIKDNVKTFAQDEYKSSVDI